MDQRILKVHPEDNVVVALVSIPAGTELSVGDKTIVTLERIPAKQKITLEPLTHAESVIMYGVLVGRVATSLDAGSLLSPDRIRHAAAPAEVRQQGFDWTGPPVDDFSNRTFLGYHRDDGTVGTANYWLVLPLVFCENRNIDVLRHALETELGYGTGNHYRGHVRALVDQYRMDSDGFGNHSVKLEDQVGRSPGPRLFQNVDGIRFLKHEGGCGGTRDDARTLCGLLAGYANNPNVAGVSVLSLGCQHAQVSLFREELTRRSPSFAKPLLVFEQQRYGSEAALMSAAITETFAGLVEVNRIERKPASLDKLVLGVECGGSDGFSGISANPAIGSASDRLVQLGGSVILSEFPELCGVEQNLVDRCLHRDTAERFLALMSAYGAAAEAVGSGFDMNPSPGNIRDGLVTDAIKSAGAARKGGTSPVVDVLDYPETIRRRGLSLLCTPGNDVESTTAMAGAGANIMCFSTGLGTPTGNPVTPVIKISTNSEVARRMPDIIDLDAGSIIRGERSIDEVGAEILDVIIEVASGRKSVKAEQLGQYDFIPWKRGVSL